MTVTIAMPRYLWLYKSHLIQFLIFIHSFLISASLPLLILFVTVDPYNRGFFCDDESLMHPYKDSTVKNWMLYILGFVLPIAIVSIQVVIEYYLFIS